MASACPEPASVRPAGTSAGVLDGVEAFAFRTTKGSTILPLLSYAEIIAPHARRRRRRRKDVGGVLIASECSKPGGLSSDLPEQIKDAENAFGLSEFSIVAVQCIAPKNLTRRFNRLREANPSTRKSSPNNLPSPLERHGRNSFLRMMVGDMLK